MLAMLAGSVAASGPDGSDTTADAASSAAGSSSATIGPRVVAGGWSLRYGPEPAAPAAKSVGTGLGAAVHNDILDHLWHFMAGELLGDKRWAGRPQAPGGGGGGRHRGCTGVGG